MLRGHFGFLLICFGINKLFGLRRNAYDVSHGRFCSETTAAISCSGGGVDSVFCFQFSGDGDFSGRDDPGSEPAALFVFHQFLQRSGQTRTKEHGSNWASMILFFFAMAFAAFALILFFITFTTCIDRRKRALHLSRFGAVLGVGAALCFVGVAATPWNLFIEPHMTFVLWAFRLFLGAIVLNYVAVLFTPGLPRRFSWIFAAFALLLFGYLLLLTAGPPMDTPAGLMVQATGQKIIAYSAVLTVLVQSLNMRRHLLKTHTI